MLEIIQTAKAQKEKSIVTDGPDMRPFLQVYRNGKHLCTIIVGEVNRDLMLQTAFFARTSLGAEEILMVTDSHCMHLNDNDEVKSKELSEQIREFMKTTRLGDVFNSPEDHPYKKYITEALLCVHMKLNDDIKIHTIKYKNLGNEIQWDKNQIEQPKAEEGYVADVAKEIMKQEYRMKEIASHIADTIDKLKLIPEKKPSEKRINEIADLVSYSKFVEYGCIVQINKNNEENKHMTNGSNDLINKTFGLMSFSS